MNDEIKINKANKSLTFINNGIAYSQFGIADEILDLITNLQQENEDYKLKIEKAVEIIDLIKPELWNISNKMTYKLIDIKNILQNGSDK